MIQKKMGKNTLIWLSLLITILAIVSRFFMLTEKPIHFDEGINGWFSMKMNQMGFYKYDPQNYHGPLYFYLLNWSEALFGQSVWTLRFVPSVFGVASIAMFALAAVFLQPFYIGVAGALLISPAFIFFARSGIHEMPFVFFQLLLGLSLYEWFKEHSQRSLMGLILALWGLILLKETFALTLMGIVFSALLMGPKFWKQHLSFRLVKPLGDRTFWKFFTGLLILFILFFSGFLKNLQGLIDLFKAFMPWLKTGTHGNGHEKEFLYWLQVMWQAEPLAIWGLVLAVWGLLQKKSSELRFFSLFAISQVLVYSIIPYKTVWCLISIIWPLYFVSALWTQSYFRLAPTKVWIQGGLAAMAVLLSIRSAYSSSYRHPIDFDHPFVYVNSTYTVKELQGYLDLQQKIRPEIKTQLMQVGLSEQWPWPWILRSFENLSYQVCAKEILHDAIVYLCEESESDFVERQISEPYWRVRAPLRQTRQNSVVYFKKSIFAEPPSATAELINSGESK